MIEIIATLWAGVGLALLGVAATAVLWLCGMLIWFQLVIGWVHVYLALRYQALKPGASPLRFVMKMFFRRVNWFTYGNTRCDFGGYRRGKRVRIYLDLTHNFPKWSVVDDISEAQEE